MLEGRCAPCHDTNFQVLPCCGELHGCEANLYVLEILFNFSKKIDCGPLDCVDHVFSGPTNFNMWACCCGFGFCYDCQPSYFLLHCKISRFHAFWFVLLSVCFLVLCLTWVQSFNQSPYVVGCYSSSLGLDTDYFVTASYSSSIVYFTTKNKQITQWNTTHSIACI